jgi:hypothetical protein
LGGFHFAEYPNGYLGFYSLSDTLVVIKIAIGIRGGEKKKKKKKKKTKFSLDTHIGDLMTSLIRFFFSLSLSMPDLPNLIFGH